MWRNVAVWIGRRLDSEMTVGQLATLTGSEPLNTPNEVSRRRTDRRVGVMRGRWAVVDHDGTSSRISGSWNGIDGRVADVVTVACVEIALISVVVARPGCHMTNSCIDIWMASMWLTTCVMRTVSIACVHCIAVVACIAVGLRPIRVRLSGLRLSGLRLIRLRMIRLGLIVVSLIGGGLFDSMSSAVTSSTLMSSSHAIRTTHVVSFRRTLA